MRGGGSKYLLYNVINNRISRHKHARDIYFSWITLGILRNSDLTFTLSKLKIKLLEKIRVPTCSVKISYNTAKMFSKSS